ncbi:MAG: ArsR family transcriptional regulator [Acidobacteria bacterium]|nr:MAG: ArsR family transcriptional regulator [Acidobacteriota bacterium]
MNPRQAKDDLYEQFARIGKVISHPKRLEILDLLRQSERSVDEIAGLTGVTVTSASAQLQVLRQGRLVQARRSGRQVIYSLADEAVARLVEALQETARNRLAEVGELLRDAFDSDALAPIRQQDLAARLEDPNVIVIDVRPAKEYLAGHIAGAISMPIDDLVTRLHELPRGAEIVAYCRGPYCVLAPQAVEAIRNAGHDSVRRLETGLPQWRAAGLPIDTTVPNSA